MTFSHFPITQAAAFAVPRQRGAFNLPPVEKYLPPKHLAVEICSTRGLCFTADYIRAIRRESERKRDGLFIAGCARPSELLEWLRVHPRFSRRSVRVHAAAA